MSDFATSLRRPSGAGPTSGPAPMGPMGAGGPPVGAPGMPPGGAGGGLAAQLASTNQALAMALQSGDIPPDAMAELEKLAKLLVTFAQQTMAPAGNRGPAGPAGPAGPPPTSPRGPMA